MQSSRPLVVLVSGAPGSGKTTLGRRLATDIGSEFLSKDAIKERLADVTGQPRTVAASSRLGARAYAELFARLRALAAAGTDVVAESNFRRGRSERELVVALAGRGARVVHCTAPPETIARRYGSRGADRHPSHLDALRADDLLRDIEAGLYEPLALGEPTLEVDTGEGYRPSYEAVLAFVRSA